VIFQKFFARLDLKSQLRRGFEPLARRKVFPPATVFLPWIVPLRLGFRELQDGRYSRDDPLVQRLLGLQRLPDVATVSRVLKQATAQSVERRRRFLRDRVLDGLRTFPPARVTVDFDGSVLSPPRRAEGTAVGFNQKKKGARRYYPLFGTIAQTGPVLDFLFRPGNVPEAQGAEAFVRACIEAVRAVRPKALIEIRMDSAFFRDTIVGTWARPGVEFTISVPFERFVELKRIIEQRRRGRRGDGETHFFEAAGKPQCWDRHFRFVFLRTRAQKQPKGPIPWDWFEPYEYG
jgi:ribonuclease HI